MVWSQLKNKKNAKIIQKALPILNGLLEFKSKLIEVLVRKTIVYHGSFKYKNSNSFCFCFIKSRPTSHSKGAKSSYPKQPIEEIY
jgi:hypothetical protein